MAKTRQPSVHWKSDEEMLEALEQAKGELRLEGLELDEEQAQLLAQEAREGWTDEEFKRRVLAFVQKRRNTNK